VNDIAGQNSEHLYTPLTGTRLPPTPPHRYPRTVAKMVLAKSKKAVGLGNSLMNDRFGKGKGADMRRGTFQTGIERTNHQTGEKVSSGRLTAFWCT
jgi:hypothetical protein